MQFWTWRSTSTACIGAAIAAAMVHAGCGKDAPLDDCRDPANANCIISDAGAEDTPENDGDATDLGDTALRSLVIENFDDLAQSRLALCDPDCLPGGDCGTASPDHTCFAAGDRAIMNVSIVTDSSIVLGNEGKSARLDFSVMTSGSFAGYSRALGGLPVMGQQTGDFNLRALSFESLSFWIKTDGASAGVDLEVGLRDVYGNLSAKVPTTSYVPGQALAESWTRVSIPLVDLATGGVNFEHVQQVDFAFVNGLGSVTFGSVYLDDIAFERTYSEAKPLTGCNLEPSEDPDGDCMSLQGYLWGDAPRDLLRSRLGAVGDELDAACAVVVARSLPVGSTIQGDQPVLVYCPTPTKSAKSGNSIVFLARWVDWGEAENVLKGGLLPVELETNACGVLACTNPTDVGACEASPDATNACARCACESPRSDLAHYAANGFVSRPTLLESGPGDEVVIQATASRGTLVGSFSNGERCWLPPLDLRSSMTLTVHATRDMTRIRIASEVEMTLPCDLQVPKLGLRPFGVIASAGTYQNAQMLNPDVDAHQAVPGLGSELVFLDSADCRPTSGASGLALPLRTALTGGNLASNIAFCIRSLDAQFLDSRDATVHTQPVDLGVFFGTDSAHVNIAPYSGSPDSDLTLVEGTHRWTTSADMVAFRLTTSPVDEAELKKACPP